MKVPCTAANRSTPRPGDKGVRSKLTLKDQWSVRADEHGASTGTTSRPGVPLSVDGNVTGEDDRIPTIPGGTLDPVDCIKDGSGRTVAGINVVNAFDIVIAGFLEELHEHGLNRLCLVNDSLSADVETANRLGVDVVLFH